MSLTLEEIRGDHRQNWASFTDFLSPEYLELGSCDSVLVGILNERISKAGHEHSDQGKPAALGGTAGGWGAESRAEEKQRTIALERQEGDTSVSGFPGRGSRVPSGRPAFQIASFMTRFYSKQQMTLEGGQCEG